MAKGADLPYYRRADRGTRPGSGGINHAIYTHCKSAYLTLFQLIGDREQTTAVADKFLTWPLGPGQIPVKPSDELLEQWCRQFDNGAYEINEEIRKRITERYRNFHRHKVLNMTGTGAEAAAKVALQLLNGERQAQSVDASYMRDLAYSGSIAAESLSRVEAHQEKTTVAVAGNLIINPGSRPAKKRIKWDSRKKKRLREIEEGTVNGEFREVE